MHFYVSSCLKKVEINWIWSHCWQMFNEQWVKEKMTFVRKRWPLLNTFCFLQLDGQECWRLCRHPASRSDAPTCRLCNPSLSSSKVKLDAQTDQTCTCRDGLAIQWNSDNVIMTLFFFHGWSSISCSQKSNLQKERCALNPCCTGHPVALCYTATAPTV